MRETGVDRPSLPRWVGMLVVLMTIGIAAHCAPAADSPATSSTQSITPIDPDTFARFADEQINRMIAGDNFPGAAIVLVQDGHVVFQRGYGITSLTSRDPVDPEQTRFRVGSISKLFTTTAVLQQVERGKLSLDDPIQKLLPDIPLGPAGDGVLVRNLLTHTDGFDVGWSIGSAVVEPLPALPLKDFLQAHVPRRILPPGQMYVYSDVGMALAGHLVENVSGKSFEQYVEEEILSPLAMTHATFRQPPPGENLSRIAQGYRRFRGEYHAVPLEHVLATPSAALTVTPADMSRFMLAYLNAGELDGQRILQPQTARLMQDQQFTHHPALPGTSFGLYERIVNGQRVLQHGGVLPGFHTQILFVPAQRLGLFITTNAYGGEDFEAMTQGFFDRFFAMAPATVETTAPTPLQTTVSLTPDPQDLSGRYRYVQYPHYNMVKLCIFAGLVEEMRVRQQPDGSIIVDQGLKGPFAYIGPMLYARGEEKIAFRTNAAGKTIGAAYDTWAFEKIHWYESRRAQMVLIGGLLSVFVLAVVARMFIRLTSTSSVESRHRGKVRPKICADLAAVACAVNLIFLGGMVYSVMSADMFDWYHGLPGFVVALGYVAWVGVALTIATLICTIFSIHKRQIKSWTKYDIITHLIALAALLIFPVFCWYWNLLTLPRWLPGS